ncbi:MAG: CehA/McbA family metallohydrolase [Anaerolineae bacterium]|nr:CehA/McbA family metallohydrolase [Thermoflexales bacterium]MDW8406143.1 CehA/McbA family metallohydrolase [Anaerolineae bacterium]
MHTPYSDGALYHRAIADAASAAGLDVIVVTDHNVLVRGIERYLGGVLVLVGEEIHDCRRDPQVSHLLVYNVGEELAPLADKPQELVRQARQRGGLTFLAHPIEYGSALDPELEAIPWADWEVKGFTGIELWNYMSDFKARLWSAPAALFAIFFPSWVVRGPFPAALRKWDELLVAGQRVVAIGNADAHGSMYRRGPLRRVIFPYRFLFGCVNTHVLIDKPLTRDVAVDRALVYGALRAGHCFIGYDAAGPTRGFRFTARSGAEMAIMGDEINRRGAVRLEVVCPAGGDIRLVRNGEVVARATGRALEHLTVDPGVYRVEVYRRYRLLKRGWIFSNPIYVR